MGAKRLIPIGSKINTYQPVTKGLAVPKAANDNIVAANDNGLGNIPKKYVKAAAKGNLSKIANGVLKGVISQADANALLGITPASAAVALGATLVGGYVQGSVMTALSLVPGFYAPGFTVTKQCPLIMSVPPGSFVQGFRQTAYSPQFGNCNTGQNGAGMVPISTPIAADIQTFLLGPEQIRPGLSTRFNHWQVHSRPLAGVAPVTPTVVAPGVRNFPVPQGSAMAPAPNPNTPVALVPSLPPVPDMIPPDLPAPDPVAKWETGAMDAPTPKWWKGQQPRMTPSAPPPKGTEERKAYSKVRGAGAALAAAMDRLSEGAEVVDAIYKALPPELRAKIESNPAHSDKRGWADQFGQYGIAGADWKLVAIYQNVDKLDVAQAFKNIIVNEAEDRVYGAAFRAKSEALAAGHSDRYRRKRWK